MNQFKIYNYLTLNYTNSKLFRRSMSNQEPKQAELLKVIERENVISYKKKPKNKELQKSQNNQDEDNVSAQSLQSGVYSEDVSRMKGKINPLPELGKQRKRFIAKNLLTQDPRMANNYFDKQVRQHDNLLLKQKNNFLASQNLKLKTKITTLEKENFKLQKIIQQQPSKSKTPGLSGGLNKQRFRGTQTTSMKVLLKNLRKQLDEVKKQNTNIKSSIKFTTITELQCERDAILQQTTRLRVLLEDEQNRRVSMKINQQGMSHLQQRIASLQQKNLILMRQNNQLQNKLKKNDDFTIKAGKISDNQKNLNKMLYNTRRLLKQKQKQVEQLRDQIKTMNSIGSIGGIQSDKSINSQLNQPALRKPSVQKSNPASSKNFQNKRIVSKSAQKYRIGSDKHIQKCQNCKKIQEENKKLKDRLKELQNQLMQINPLSLSSAPVATPKKQQTESLKRFLSLRFKAHHLLLKQSERYLLNAEAVNEDQLKKEITIGQFIEGIIAEPFGLVNKRYIQIFILTLCFKKQLQKNPQSIQIDENKKITKKEVLQNYQGLMAQFQLTSQQKEEEMFVQVSQLVTSYYQHILAALTNRKNGEGTISQKDLVSFFTEIQLEMEYIDFIIAQIILQSLDLDRLNYYAMFEIFYLPQEQLDATKLATDQAAMKKKKFQVDHVVKQEDQEYEESRSHLQVRQKTLSKKQDASFNDGTNNIYEHDEQFQQNNENKQKVEQYEQDQGFQEQKMNRQLSQEQKNNESPKKLIQKPYQIEDIADQYNEQFQS